MKKIIALVLPFLLFLTFASNANAGWVNGYYRNGTWVNGYYRSDPNGLKYDNYGWQYGDDYYNDSYYDYGRSWEWYTPSWQWQNDYWYGLDYYDNYNDYDGYWNY